MAITPTIIWTALPNGLEAGTALRMSIYVSPRLQDPSGTTLADYTLGNWPNYVLSLAQAQRLFARLGPGGPMVQLAVNVGNLRPDLWDALFPSTTPVTQFQFRDHARRAIRSYSTKAIHDYIESLYTGVANASGSSFPDINAKNDVATLVSVLGASMDVVRARSQGSGMGKDYVPPLPPGINDQATRGPHPDAGIEAQLTALVPMGSNVPAAEFFRAWRFYNRGQQETYRSQLLPRVPADIPPPLTRPKFDFHQVLAALGDHPAVLRALGIVIDGILIADMASLANFSQIQVQVMTAAGAPSPTDQTPWTAFDATSFGILSRAGSDLSRGYLQLGDTNAFTVYQADVDGHALRTFDFGVSMYWLLKQRLTEAATACDALGIPPDPKAHTEPQSLPALRNGGITVARTDRDKIVYQQFVNSGTNNADPPNAILYYEDVLRGYRVDVRHRSNWYSLCQRVPQYGIGSIALSPGADEGFVKAVSGTSTSKDPPMGPPVERDLYLHEAIFGWNNWSLVVPHPGRSISFKRNDVDRTQTVVVQREDNLADPDFPLRITANVPGKTLPPLRFGESYSLRARAVDLAGNGLPLSDTGSANPLFFSPPVAYLRHEPIAAPALVLRAPLTPGESAEHVVIRSKVGTDPITGEGAIFNAKSERHVAPPKTSQRMAELHGAFDSLFANPDAAYAVAVRESGTFADPGGDVQLINADGMSVDPMPLNQRGEPLPDGHYVIHTSDQPALPYLPDPLVKGVAFQPPAVSMLTKDFVGAVTWPNLSTFRLVLVAEPGATPTFDVADVVTVRVPKGTMLTVRYSSTLPDTKLPLMARWVAMSPAAQAMTMANGYQHWMITPYREITFVHAVEKPMAAPTLDATLSVSRALGETFATLRGSILNHSTSTGQLDLMAAWTETIDRVQLPAAVTDTRSGRVFERTVGYDEATAPFPDPKACAVARHEFGDTKHRWVKYHAVATTRYREYFPTIAQTPSLIQLAGPELAAVNVPSSARPVPPRILYILPTFQWQLSPDNTVSTRVGRGLRVYVDRPWYASGDDELLGVIVPPAGKISDELRKYVSEWGSDPVWNSIGPSTELAPENFVSDPMDPTSKTTVATGLSLAEADPNDSTMWVTAVGIQPQYNKDRQLYYFDIVLDPGSTYYPFVRLALARFQPYSLTHAHLSRVVRAEFAQLVADRAASIAYNGKTSVDVVVSGVTARNQVAAKVSSVPSAVGRFGPSAGGGMMSNPTIGGGHLVRAYVERRTDASLGDMGWQGVGTAVVLASYSLMLAPQTAFWRGTVNLPSSIGDGAAYRLAVQELEIFETDAPVAESDLSVTNPNNVPIRSRLVYFDAIPLSP
jgi:hypothetical protein